MPKTLITLLLDRSGSMASIKDDTIGGFNAYVDTLKAADAGDIDFTFLQFDSNSIDKICVAVPVAQVPQLDASNYVPGASTPLIDAAYKTIKAVEKSLDGHPADAKIIVCIQTDGQENCSTDHTWHDLTLLIKEKTAAGWQFNFMGTGIDAYAQGAQMGIAASNTVSTGRDARSVRASFAASADNAAAYARGKRADMSYTSAQRAASGDAYADKIKGLNQDPAKPATPAKPAAPAPTPKAVDKRSVVDDFTL
jgi:hypothetical protein